MSISLSDRFFFSWSGGKDSCLSLYRFLNNGYSCASLFTIVDESGSKRPLELKKQSVTRKNEHVFLSVAATLT
ncbi:MAG: hypothetical protein ACLFQB_09225 [Chitinispirillaceae bacterium]